MDNKGLEEIFKSLSGMAKMSQKNMDALMNTAKMLDFGDVVIPYSNINYPMRNGTGTKLFLKTGDCVEIPMSFEEVKKILGV